MTSAEPAAAALFWYFQTDYGGQPLIRGLKAAPAGKHISSDCLSEWK